MCLVITFQTPFRKPTYCFTRHSRRQNVTECQPESLTVTFHKPLSILLSPTGVTPHLKIDRSATCRVTLRSHRPSISHIRGDRNPFIASPHPNNEDELREPNPNMHPTSSRATLVTPRDLLRATERPPVQHENYPSGPWPGSRPRATPEAPSDR